MHGRSSHTSDNTPYTRQNNPENQSISAAGMPPFEISDSRRSTEHPTQRANINHPKPSPCSQQRPRCAAQAPCSACNGAPRTASAAPLPAGRSAHHTSMSEWDRTAVSCPSSRASLRVHQSWKVHTTCHLTSRLFPCILRSSRSAG